MIEVIEHHALGLIASCAQVPSFTTFEDRLHPTILALAGRSTGVRVYSVLERNLVVHIPGDGSRKPIALAAHLDKINHFGPDWKTTLPVSVTDEVITGQMDDSVGLGMCLSMLAHAKTNHFPPIYLLLSECEEGNGPKTHAEWMRDGGQTAQAGLGARRISTWLLERKIFPEVIITIDTTPLFKGEKGLAIYTNHWEKNGTVPTDGLITATEAAFRTFAELHPGLLRYNNTNDYLVYGLEMNVHPGTPVVSVALEPAIYPYHQAGESVFISDIEVLEELLVRFLNRSGISEEH